MQTHELPIAIRSHDLRRPPFTALDRIVRDVLDGLRVVYPWCIVTIEARGDVRGAWHPGRIAQAVANLIGNALAHGAGGIVVDIFVRDAAAHVELEIQHDGHTTTLVTLPRSAAA